MSFGLFTGWLGFSMKTTWLDKKIVLLVKNDLCCVSTHYLADAWEVSTGCLGITVLLAKC